MRDKEYKLRIAELLESKTERHQLSIRDRLDILEYEVSLLKNPTVNDKPEPVIDPITTTPTTGEKLPEPLPHPVVGPVTL